MSAPETGAAAWAEAMAKASNAGERGRVRSFAEAWDAVDEPRDPPVRQQTATDLPLAAKDGKAKPTTGSPFGDGPRRVVGAWEPPPPPKRYRREYTEDGVCRLVVEGSAEDPHACPSIAASH